MFTIKRCSLIRGVHYERFHYNVIGVYRWILPALALTNTDKTAQSVSALNLIMMPQISDHHPITV